MVRANEEERSGSISLFDNEEEIYKFKATITYCRYYNDSSTWGVYGFSTDDDIPHFTKEIKKIIITTKKIYCRQFQRSQIIANIYLNFTI